MASARGDDFYLIDDGRMVRRGRMAELVRDEALKKRYLGV